MMKNWLHILILLTLDYVEIGVTTEDITNIILQDVVKLEELVE
jgi:hypothetical protein